MANTVIYALLGGILPALIWLIFWLREDRLSPEPRLFIFRTFIFGMLGVLLITVGAIVFEDQVGTLLNNLTIGAIFLLATLEESLKLLAAYFGGLDTSEDNEPIDPMIYTITAALGFVALENALFILGPLMDGQVAKSILTGDMRFIGASLLHVVSSGLIGVAISFSFYKSRTKKILASIIGLVGAIIFHTFFNTLITFLNGTGNMWSSIAVWIGVIFLLWAFEKAKSIAPQNQ
ncbi:MAG: PrsW family intramembrane metalloprotease [Candidatus Zambryskibacteria bacterium]|nr:PrsW family intramembrane metalloprotease [Candidatus Zambryskibacteria bacterium]